MQFPIKNPLKYQLNILICYRYEILLWLVFAIVGIIDRGWPPRASTDTVMLETKIIKVYRSKEKLCG